ncbi:MAG TPA: tetratricopeptide repeat protein [Verrucomicrobiae bacterium]|nr:tetratricopeptide repeat protein [Verrucomicrobiae bacterium]
MFLKTGFRHWFVGLALCASLCGCLPSSQGPLDEQKEPHFLTGKARENALDYKGAIEAFEKALEVNPQNGSAHFELGLLYEKETDYAAAIYHFERFLKLRPASEYSQIVKERVTADKMELSKTAAFAPVTQNLQKEFDKLAEENKQLRAELDQWRAYYARQTRARVASGSVETRPPEHSVGPRTPAVSGAAGATANSSSAASDPPSRSVGATAARTYAVKSGETLTAIAKKYGVRLESLVAANPGLDPRRMKVGQTINIPAQ